jgi:hypothetical protein
MRFQPSDPEAPYLRIDRWTVEYADAVSVAAAVVDPERLSEVSLALKRGRTRRDAAHIRALTSGDRAFKCPHEGCKAPVVVDVDQVRAADEEVTVRYSCPVHGSVRVKS